MNKLVSIEFEEWLHLRWSHTFANTANLLEASGLSDLTSEVWNQWYLKHITTWLNSILPWASLDQPVLNLTCQMKEKRCVWSLLMIMEYSYFWLVFFTWGGIQCSRLESKDFCDLNYEIQGYSNSVMIQEYKADSLALLSFLGSEWSSKCSKCLKHNRQCSWSHAQALLWTWHAPGLN